MEKENRIFTLRMGLLIPVAILYCIAAAEAIVGLLSFDIDAYWEMLVQMDENGDPVLLPALPSDWHSGKLTGMRIPGNKVLSFAWENGAVTELMVQEL